MALFAATFELKFGFKYLTEIFIHKLEILAIVLKVSFTACSSNECSFCNEEAYSIYFITLQIHVSFY